jgi:4-hydroxy-tetrahydrodipicolinate synthase
MFVPEGIICPIAIPFNKDYSIDEESLRNHVRYLVESGISGISPNAGTSEAISLSLNEQKEILEIVTEETGGKKSIVPGILYPGIGDCIESINYIKEIGVDAVLLITPYYSNPSQQGIFEYYRFMSEMIDVPLIIYNIPKRTGSNVEPHTLARLAELDSIVGIKECNREMGQYLDKVRLVGDKISILAGDDDIALLQMAHGAKGAILASANLIPEVWNEIFEASNKGQYDKAEAIFEKYIPLIKALFPPGEQHPAPLKEALRMKGKMESYVRKPVQNVKEENSRKIKNILERLNLL